jgi:hypothetical protein
MGFFCDITFNDVVLETPVVAVAGTETFTINVYVSFEDKDTIERFVVSERSLATEGHKLSNTVKV